jgi:hypothetical protein
MSDDLYRCQDLTTILLGQLQGQFWVAFISKPLHVSYLASIFNVIYLAGVWWSGSGC